MTGLLAKDVSVRLDGNLLLDRVSLRVEPAEWLGVIGPNGAGKSTLLRAVAGLVACTGRVELCGEPLDSLAPRARAQRVALVPQVPLVPAGITVADYVLLGRTPHLGRFAFERRSDLDVVSTVLDALDLQRFAGRRVDSLSGGERQRALLGRALAQEAPILLLDEPTTSLDIGHQQDVLELIDELRRTRNLAVVTTMHDLTLAGRYPHRLLLLANGVVITSGPSDNVLTEEHLAQHYGASVRILRDEHGIIVVPYRATREDR
ncbi:MAG TPA: ABC transporter ATP-binding protein [Acidimicrobiales bacterium]|jgi:iron complex transport system ATP-binding protein|nr:ABC transporter ATP-binding protein [Acidimicrobiales bacterium]